jgi:hypothetical protein
MRAIVVHIASDTDDFQPWGFGAAVVLANPLAERGIRRSPELARQPAMMDSQLSYSPGIV